MNPRYPLRGRPWRALAALCLLLSSSVLAWPAGHGAAAPARAGGALSSALAFYFPWLDPSSFTKGQMSDMPVADPTR